MPSWEDDYFAIAPQEPAKKLIYRPWRKWFWRRIFVAAFWLSIVPTLIVLSVWR